ncbi:PIN domain-containing protein [Deinococcus sp. YIM 134068]|uniref:PIN domain-containing protein n=1 Tax=Deinococcus lichenicola TaxID=3118910 RepID=UPI002F92C283
MLVLDTNVLIALQKRNQRVLAEYVRALERDEVLAVPALVRYEARKELLNPLYARRLTVLDGLLSLHPTLDLDTETTDIAAVLFENLRAGGNLIEDADLLIAATALRHRAILVTHNTRHFDRIPGLSLTDWQKENPIS